MKSFSRIISVLIILAVIGFVAMYTFSPGEVKAPSDDASREASRSDVGDGRNVTAHTVTIKEAEPAAPTVAVEYPQFSALPAEFNAAISAAVLGRLADFRETIKENEEARRATAAPGEPATPLSAYSFSASWQSVQTNDAYVSLVIRYDAYAGGANGDQELETFNYDVAHRKMVALDDLFADKKDYLKQVSALVRKELTAALDKISDGNAPTEEVVAGTEPRKENFSSFTFTDSDITFYFPKYSVAPGSFGEQRVTIARDLIK